MADSNKLAETIPYRQLDMILSKLASSAINVQGFWSLMYLLILEIKSKQTLTTSLILTAEKQSM
jgi:hypothetical protein